jgi:hypothetical protein
MTDVGVWSRAPGETKEVFLDERMKADENHCNLSAWWSGFWR